MWGTETKGEKRKKSDGWFEFESVQACGGGRDTRKEKYALSCREETDRSNDGHHQHVNGEGGARGGSR